MIRIAWNILCALSLLACMATALEWARSYSSPLFISSSAGRPGKAHVCFSSEGRIRWHAYDPVNPAGVVERHGGVLGVRWGRKVDSLFDNGRWRATGSHRYFEVPHSLLALIGALLPTCWIFAERRRRRHLAGHCSACGYDLRATPNRCPECGATPAGGAPT